MALPGLTLKRVELLQFENRPLAQLLYQGDMVLSHFASCRSLVGSPSGKRSAGNTAFCSSVAVGGLVLLDKFLINLLCDPVTFEKDPSRPAENVQSRSSFAGVPLLGCLYKGVETLPQEPSDLS